MTQQNISQKQQYTLIQFQSLIAIVWAWQEKQQVVHPVQEADLPSVHELINQLRNEGHQQFPCQVMISV